MYLTIYISQPSSMLIDLGWQVYHNVSSHIVYVNVKKTKITKRFKTDIRLKFFSAFAAKTTLTKFILIKIYSL